MASILTHEESLGLYLRELKAAIRELKLKLIKNREDANMPGRKHLRGVGDKEQREYEHIKESAKISGCYGGRAEEVAARTVMKHHKKSGHSTGQ